ncbi:uncharacterized protein LOC124141925 [Haliotis rufescens]|uniref:uncharacterized protein LOC124141925 n=1 Tax=Haliotis rufescens TaxID=6454 RepID=UPI00201F694F|nr:uncharacterized protein LOC124141925 [Haliotis rufescens]
MRLEKASSRRPVPAMHCVVILLALMIPAVISRAGIISMKLQPDLYAQIAYSLNDEGCDINGTTKSYGGEFSLDITGPCVTYLCSTTGVSMKEGAGCMGEDGCVAGLERYGCQAFVCKNSGHTFNGKKYMWIVDTNAKEQCGILDEQNCYELDKWYMVLNFQCMCESTTEVVCSLNEQSSTPAAVANTSDDIV